MGHVIGAVERLTGIPRNTISAWERRYGLVRPVKCPDTGHRLYSDADVAVLRQVRDAIDAGLRVSEAVRKILD